MDLKIFINLSYGTSVNVSGFNCPIQLNCNLYRDNIVVSNPEVIVLGVESYNYTFNATGNNNYSDGSVSFYKEIWEIL